MRKNKSIIIFSILAVFILTDLCFFLPMQLSKARKINRRSLELREKIDSLNKDLQNKQGYINQNQSLERKLRDIQVKFLAKDDAAVIISKINRISKDMSLDVTSIKPQSLQEISKKTTTKKKKKKQEKQGISFYYLPVDLRFNSGYHVLGEFINRLERLDFSLELNQLSITDEVPFTVVNMRICGIVKE